MRNPIRQYLRDIDLLVNGKTALKGLNFFKSANSLRALPKSKANCRLTTAKLTRTQPKLEFKEPNRLYRIN